MVREMEAEGRHTIKAPLVEPTLLSDAWDKYLADLNARNRHASTIAKYDLLRRQMLSFAQSRGLRFLVQFDLDALSSFRAGWRDGPLTSLKKLERLRTFFRFAHKRKWVEDNPACDLEVPTAPARPTMDFTDDEIVRIIAALDTYWNRSAPSGRNNARRLRALVLLLYYSGLRISDVVGLTGGRIIGNRLFLYTQKTGVPVYAKLPDFVARVLETTPRVTTTRFFWSGLGKLESAVRSWQTRLRRLFQLAKVPDGHAHRFRDTFAVRLLLAGIPIDRVSILLGHRSVKVTERHYAPWTASRQQQIEADLEQAWSRDPIVRLETYGTPLARENADVVN